MKATQRDFSRIAPEAAGRAQIFLFCGPDEAGAFAGAEKIISLLPDPGERIELASAELKRDPVRLSDEARSASLFGDARHILVRAQGDEAYDAIANLVESDVEPCPVLIVATGATDKSRSAKLLADRPDALVAMFWLPDLRSVTGTVRAMADAAGLRMGADIAQLIAQGAGLDIRLAQSEIDKLALYLDAGPEQPRTVDRKTLDAIGTQSEEDGFAPLVDAVLGGDAARLGSELRRMREVDLNPVAVLLAFERRTAQLAALAAKLGPRSDVDGLLEAERAARRIFWKEQGALANQLRRWRGKRLQRLVERLVTLHRDMLAKSQDAELLLRQGLADIARFAANRG